MANKSLKQIASEVMDEWREEYAAVGIRGGKLVDAQDGKDGKKPKAKSPDDKPVSLKEHDDQYHHGHYQEGEECSVRDKMKTGDDPDANLSQQKPKATAAAPATTGPSKRDRVKEIFREWRHNNARTNEWVAKNLGVTDKKKMKAVMTTLMDYLSNKYGKHDTVDKLNDLCSAIPSDAWKPDGKSKPKSAFPSASSSSKGSDEKGKDPNAAVKQSIRQKADAAIGNYVQGFTGFGTMLDAVSKAAGTMDGKNQITDQSKDDRIRKLVIDWRNKFQPYSYNDMLRDIARIAVGQEPKHTVSGKQKKSSLTQGDLFSSSSAKGSSSFGTSSYSFGSLPLSGSGTTSQYSKHFHSQGSKTYTDRLHKPTGLYKTQRPGGAALARAEDVPGKVGNSKNRPAFVEQGNLPDTVTQEQLDDFRYTANGSTYPMVGNIGGRNYIVKRGKLPHGVRRNDDLSDHIDKEVAADQFIRAAGLRAPQCKTFELNGEHNKIAEYVDGGNSLVRSWDQGTRAQKSKIRQQVIDAYPVMSFLANIDAFKNDNILVDKDDNLWFVDNGACFDYRAQGGKKGWYYDRKDPTDFDTGYLGLLYNKDQYLLQEILSSVSDQELIDAAKKYDFSKLVQTLPDDIKQPSLVEYAKNLDDVIRNQPDGWPGEENA